MDEVPRFNLIDEPWIPAVTTTGAGVELGLREVLARAHELREIADPSPLVTVTLHRLLLALLHRNLGPTDVDAWQELWEAGRLPMEQLDPYLGRWRHRFNLFDPEHPFSQHPTLDVAAARSIALMVHGLTLGNYATLFDHSLAGDPPALSPAEAARQLLAMQAFALGGLVSLQKGENPQQYKSADAAPLTKGAVALLKGATLFETLLLNLTRYDPEDGVPVPVHGDDQPAWERDAPVDGMDRRPDGYVDLLTWQSRRVRLLPELRDGHVVVRRATVMKGYQFPDGWQPATTEPMLAFKVNAKAKANESPYTVLSFRPERALWRDSLALVESSGAQFQRPRMLEWVAELTRQRVLPRDRSYAVEVLGMSIDRASVFLWRHERFPLPLAYLTDRELQAALAEGLALAERVGRLFVDQWITLPGGAGGHRSEIGPLWEFAQALLAPSEAVSVNPDAVRGLIGSLGPGRDYWARLEVPFGEFVVALASDRVEVDGATRYGGRAHAHWAATLRKTARTAFRETVDGFDGSGQTLRATALAERRFNRQLGLLLTEREEGTHEHVA